jgi:hypothetical protein
METSHMLLPLDFLLNVARARSEAGAFLGSEASGASFSKNPRKRSVPEASIIYIYIYIYYYLYILRLY